MDYNQLVASQGTPGSIATWINSSTIVGDAPEIVLEAESWIYRRLKHWRMFPAPVTGSFVINQDWINFPSDMLEPSFLVTTGQYFQIIYQKPAQEVISNWQYTGTGTTRVQQQPLMYYFDQLTIRF